MLELVSATGPEDGNPAAQVAELQAIMWENAGPFRTADGLAKGLERLAALETSVSALPPGAPGAFDARRLDWFDLRNMLLVARSVVEAALLRKESRGAHQREDFPAMIDDWACNQTITLGDRGIKIERGSVLSAREAAQ
jgi:succinate dehydrogenase / fumarate reductase flavoprotein subunit/fumarate reductase (CoM/CoB) subunit A